MKQRLCILIILALLCGIGYAETRDELYLQGLKMMEAGDYLSAAEYFEALDDYLDSADKAREARARYGGDTDNRTKAADRQVEIGDHIIFGQYEQDADYGNGREPIEWVVIDFDGDNAIMVSLYGLDARPFHDTLAHATWEACGLRQWLANDFVAEAFSKEERKALRKHYVTAERNHWHSDYNPGEDTSDSVFLLSVHVFEIYMLGFDPVALGLSKNETRRRMDQLPYDSLNRCVPTEYAVRMGAKVMSGFCHWWLRSPGDGRNKAANAFTTGHYIDDHFKVTNSSVCVRPVVCVNSAEIAGKQKY